MKLQLLDLLVWPFDGDALQLHKIVPRGMKDSGLVEFGVLLCKKCSRWFPVIESIPSILPDALRGSRDRMFLERFRDHLPDEILYQTVPLNSNSSEGLKKGTSCTEEDLKRLTEIRERDKRADLDDSHFDSYQAEAELEMTFKGFDARKEDMVLDLGVGTGRFLQGCLDQCREVIGLDFSFQSLLKAKERYREFFDKRISLLHGDISFLPFKEGAFDKAICTEVLQHLPSHGLRRKAVAGIAKVLKEGGEFTCTVTNYSLQKRYYERQGKTGFVKKESTVLDGQVYCLNFEADELRTLLEPEFEVKALHGILNWIPKLSKHLGTSRKRLDSLLTRTPLSLWLGDLLLIKGKKRSNKITIMYIIDDLLIGGAQKVLLNSINAMNKKRYKILVVSLFEGAGLAHEIERAGAEVIFLGMAHKFDVRAFLRLIGLIRENNVMVVHTHLTIANFLGRLAARLAGTKIIVATLHNYFYFRKKLNLMIDRAMYPISSKIITVSEDMKRWFMREEKIEQDKFITIHNSIDLKEFAGVNSSRNIRQELNIDNDFPILGNIQPMREKNLQHFLVYAMSQIVKTFPKAKLLMVGDGPVKKGLERLAEKRGLNRHIFFLGFRRDIPEILSAIDIFVSCPLYEAFGMVILEAMAMKKPVVTTRVGGIPEVVSANETALLVEPGNTEQLTTAIVNLLKDKEKQRQLGFMGRKRAEEHFSSEYMVGKLEALYEELLLEVR